ncbi:MAG: BT_3928 family protein [Rikenellaceae bacterium]
MTLSDDISTPQRRLKIASHIARFIIGLAFIISGVTKVVDPWATAIKIEEYFTLYGLEILMPATMWLSIWLSSAEMMMGSMMVLKIRIRMVSIFVLFSIGFFTILTLLSATVMPVEDCGCFGEVVRLTPAQSFFKNLILLPFAIVVFWRYRRDKIFNFNTKELVVAGLLFFLIFGTALYSFLNLPIVDLLPYRKGVDLAQQVRLDREARRRSYSTILVYRDRASGELREFAIEDSEWHDDVKWEWVETKSVANVESAEVSVAPFVIFDSQGDDVTLELISKGRIHIICVTKFENIGRSCERRVVSYINNATQRGERVAVVTPQELSKITTPIKVDTYNIDPIIMRNALRAKIGVISINDGVIEEKRNCRNM